MLSNSFSTLVSEQILKERNTKHEIKLYFCYLRQNKDQGMYWLAKVSLRETDICRELDVRCRKTSKKGSEPSASSSDVNFKDGWRFEIPL